MKALVRLFTPFQDDRPAPSSPPDPNHDHDHDDDDEQPQQQPHRKRQQGQQGRHSPFLPPVPPPCGFTAGLLNEQVKPLLHAISLLDIDLAVRISAIWTKTTTAVGCAFGLLARGRNGQTDARHTHTHIISIHTANTYNTQSNQTPTPQTKTNRPSPPSPAPPSCPSLVPTPRNGSCGRRSTSEPTRAGVSSSTITTIAAAGPAPVVGGVVLMRGVWVRRPLSAPCVMR